MTKTVETGGRAGKAKKAPDTPAGLFPPAGFAPPAEFGDALAANQAVMQEMVAANQEMVAFVGKRMRADAEAFARLCRCRDLPEAMGVQAEFMSRLTEDYFAETAKLMERAARAMEQGPIRGGRAKTKK